MHLSKQAFDGILLIDKPQNCTSHDVVDRVRRKLRMQRVGHAGTLDPLATGLLIILVGRATKVSQYLMSLGKVYEGSLLLGQSTDSHDSQGQILETKPVPEMTESTVKAHMQTFIGDQYQIPPMFSAKKIDGTPLYKLARKGQVVEREPRFIHISHFDLLSYASPTLSFRLACTKGTYVRTVVHDLGQKIGCGAHMTALRRTATNHFTLEKAITMEHFDSLSISDIRPLLIPTHEAVPSHVIG